MNIKRRLILQKFIVLITTYHFLPKFDFTSSSENYTEKFDTIIALLLPNFSLSGLVNTISGIPSSEKELTILLLIEDGSKEALDVVFKLKSMIRKDYLDGKLTMTSGWILSETEVAILRLVLMRT
jgi:hypothetical protein